MLPTAISSAMFCDNNYINICDEPDVVIDADRYSGLMERLGILSPPASAGDSQESNSVGTSPMSTYAMSPPNMAQLQYMDVYEIQAQPYLEIKEQPVEKFRFRYQSEMLGAHGSLNARQSDRSRRVVYPTVELKHFTESAIISCTLYSVSDGERLPHPHRLVSGDINDPHEIPVGPSIGYQAAFSSMGIIHTARKNVTKELYEKKLRILEKIKNPSFNEKHDLKHQTEQEAKRIHLNTVCLCFEAFVKDHTTGKLKPICPKVFSEPINNRKSAMTGELKICRMDKTVSKCTGGEEVFILVEKVVKKNIKVRFFEVEDEDVIWIQDAKFNELDVHHQYAIVFKTPAYKNININKTVKVYIELYRPSDGETSEPMQFSYTPVERTGVKRMRSESTYTIPATIDNFTLCEPEMAEIISSSQARTVLSESADQIDSEEFKEVIRDLLPLYKDCQLLTTDNAKSNKKMVKSLLRTAIENDSVQKVMTDDVFLKNIVYKIKVLKSTNPENIKTKLEELFSEEHENNDTALHIAVRNPQKSDLQFLVSTLRYYMSGTPAIGRILNSCNKTESLLHTAVQCGNINAVKTFLAMDANPNKRDSFGNTPLHRAIKNNDETIVQVILKNHKVNIEIENHDALTPLHLASKQGSVDIVKLLVNAGSKINYACPKEGYTALHMVVKDNHLDVLKYLLTCTDLDVNKQSLQGDTALHIATAEKNKDAMLLLCQHGANPFIANFITPEVKDEIDSDDCDDEGGLTSVELAANNEELLKLLKFEPSSPSPDYYDAVDRNEDDKVNFDSTCLNELSELLDKSPVLLNLAELLECKDWMSSLLTDDQKNPTKMLLNYAHVNGHTVEFIRNLFEALEAMDAVEIIDRMKARQFQEAE